MELSVNENPRIRRWADLLRRWIREEDGPTATEYAAMLALLAIALVGVITQVTAWHADTFVQLGEVVSGTG